MKPKRRTIGLKFGAAMLCGVAALTLIGFVFGPQVKAPVAASEGLDTRLIDTVLADPASQTYLAKFDRHRPAAAQTFRLNAARAIGDGWTREQMEYALLETAFAQFKPLAFDVNGAPTASYDLILDAFSSGMETLDGQESPWCQGPHVAAFLTKNDRELVPALLNEFAATNEGYAWALGFAGLFLDAAGGAARNRTRHGAPTWRDEVALQQEGVAYGSQKWLLALQIGAFSNAEGQSYAMMKEAIEAMEVCELGVAIGQISRQLEPDVRGRIWSDLMPEIMYGNTPYVLSRVNDYFFIG